MVGYVFPYGSQNHSNAGAGLIDCTTGKFLANGANYNHVSAGADAHRAYQFYSNSGAVTLFGRPSINVVDGSEPSLQEYYSRGRFAGLDQINATNISTYIDSVAIGSAYIADAAINSAKIAGTIQSNNYSSTAGWQINKSGEMYLNQANVRGQINVGDYTGYTWPPAGKGGVHISSGGILFGTYNGGGKYFQVTSGMDGNQAAIYTNIPAYIEDSQITTAKIGSAQIDTLRIAGNNVTVSGQAVGTGTTTFYLNAPEGGVINIVACNMGGSGQADYLHVKVNGNTTNYFRGMEITEFVTTNQESGAGYESVARTSSAVEIGSVPVGGGNHAITVISNTYYRVLGLLTMR
jgi:hypothetical protein